MRFSADAWPGLAEGSITTTFRTWRTPQVKPGGRYRVGGMLLQVDDVRRVRVSALRAADARAAGEASLVALRKRLGLSATEVWRIDLHYVGPDDRIALRADAELDPDQLTALRARLDRLDAHAPQPWTRRTLALIAAEPAVVSTVLAERMGMPRPAFKINVRKLKNLGLTESLEIGYRLSPRGRVVLGEPPTPSGKGLAAASGRTSRGTRPGR